MISVWHIIGMLLTLLLIFGVSFYSGRKVKDARDFDTAGGKAGSGIVVGALLGTLVGGSSTVGTAQLAYDFGMSAWWFTLGGGLACLILAALFVKPIRNAGTPTLIGIIKNEYGTRVGIAASILSSIGTFINILSQLIAATAVIMIVLPDIPLSVSLIIAAALMLIYVIFGGMLGAGMVGIVKVTLLFIAVIVSMLIIAGKGGVGMLFTGLDHKKYFNLFARGFGTDGGAGLSLILGVLSTQSYAQAILAGRTDKDSIQGLLISAFLIPIIGVGGIMIGEYMRITAPNLPAAKLAFPMFVIEHVPPLLAGIILATLLITVIGTGAGLSLGISTVVNRDIVSNIKKAASFSENSLTFSRILITGILGLACFFCICPIGDTILNFAFMSMGLRGTVIFVPLCCALWLKGRVNKKWVFASVFISPLVVLVLQLMDVLSFDPLFVGMLVSLVLCVMGMIVKE